MKVRLARLMIGIHVILRIPRSITLVISITRSCQVHQPLGVDRPVADLLTLLRRDRGVAYVDMLVSTFTS